MTLLELAVHRLSPLLHFLSPIIRTDDETAWPDNHAARKANPPTEAQYTQHDLAQEIAVRGYARWTGFHGNCHNFELTPKGLKLFEHRTIGD